MLIHQPLADLIILGFSCPVNANFCEIRKFVKTLSKPLRISSFCQNWHKHPSGNLSAGGIQLRPGGDELVGHIRVVRANDKAEAVVRHLVYRILERCVLGVVENEHRRDLRVDGYVENLAPVALYLVLLGLERNFNIVVREQVAVAEQHALIIYCG